MLVALSLIAVILLSTACQAPRLPWQGGATPKSVSPAATLTPTEAPREDLPPTVIEATPNPAAELALDGRVTIAFDQPMDKESVEAALRFDQGSGGSVTWNDAATLTFAPDQNLAPATRVSLTVESSAKAENGLGLQAPVQLTYRTVDYLRMTQALPAAGSSEIDPTSAVVAAFNRPVVALGAGADEQVAPFSIQPAAEGRGEWINTSTYVFYPEPSLDGGITYTVQMNPTLKGSDSAPLDEAAERSWSFTTALPQVLQAEPGGGALLWLDAGVSLTFNQPMDPASVEQNLSLVDDNGTPVTGDFEWDADQTRVTFQPAARLPRAAVVHLTLLGQAQARGGTPIGVDMAMDFPTFPELQVSATDPVAGAVLPSTGGFATLALDFSAPIQESGIDRHISISPQISNLSTYLDQNRQKAYVSGYFNPNTAYTVTLSANLADAWGRTMGEPYTLNFQTGPAAPGLSVIASMISTGAAYLTPTDTGLGAYATNITSVNVARGSVALPDFFKLLGEGGYVYQQTYRPGNLENWSQPIQVSADQTQLVEIGVTPDNAFLSAGLYYYSIQSPELLAQGIPGNSPLLLVVSPIQLVFKMSATEALVWATRVDDLQPVAGADITLYDEAGNTIGSGETGTDGLAILPIEPLEDPYQPVYAVLGEPGQSDFSLAVSTWNLGVDPNSFGFSTDYRGPRVKSYLYSDRPIYRPGQTVYFKAIVREADYGHYELADIFHLPVEVYGETEPDGTVPLLATFDLALNSYGSGHASFILPEDAPPGYYRIHPTTTDGDDLYIQVANYRKPEIEVDATLMPEQALAGQDLQASIRAAYYFGAPAGDLPVHWALYRGRSRFDLNGASVGTQLFSAWGIDPFGNSQLGDTVSQGDARTGPDGLLELNLPTGDTEWAQLGLPGTFTLEVTITDSSGQPVSTRSKVTVHPADIYAGVQSDSQIGQAGVELGFTIQTVNWDQQAVAVEGMTASFAKVAWEEQPLLTAGQGLTQLVPVYSGVSSTDFSTDASGKARVTFTPTDPGTYSLDVTGQGAHSQEIIWVGGVGEAPWPNLPNQRLELTTDTDGSYRPGQAAQVFIPNPFGQAAQALITVERGKVLRHEIISIEGSGATYAVALTEDDAPNVYIAVTLMSKNTEGRADFRQGYTELLVEPVAQTLQVDLTSTPEQSQPGGEVTFSIRVTDVQDQPVRGEFSIAVVDLAALALAEPNEPGIVATYYQAQSLGVRSALSLAAYALRRGVVVDGRGGGGGGGPAVEDVREDFRDTAYWNAEVVTDENGEANVSIQLPENLTTWQADVRGLTADTQVGAATTEVVTSKDLLVRPVTPRFFIAGDRVELAAIVHNNTQQALDAEVALQATGFTPDSAAQVSQTVAVPAGGQTRVTWPGTVDTVGEVDLVFSARSGSLSDAARPETGRLPVYRYTSPQTFATAGVVTDSGERLEVVNLPRSFTPEGGELRVELTPSLIAAMFDGVTALDLAPYDATEPTLSRFLPNLETLRIMEQYGVSDPALQEKLSSTVTESIRRLIRRQNEDGGWSWMTGKRSDTLITAYVLMGLSQARKSGVEVSLDPIFRAQEYLKASLFAPEVSSQDWQLDRLAFIHYALEQSAVGDLDGAGAVYEVRDRLNPWAQALLAVTIENLAPDDERARTLISDLESTAIRSATGAHWEADGPGGPNPNSTVTATAIVTYAIAQRDPAAEVLPGAVRFLMANRRYGNRWASTYESAWSLMALGQVLEGTGELGSTYGYYASLNGTRVVDGQANGAAAQGAQTSLGLDNLHPDAPNALRIGRDGGPGTLYYTAALQLYRPAETAPALSAGMSLARDYTLAGTSCRASDCATIDEVNLRDDNRVTVRLTLILPQDVYHLTVEDWVAAGAEILDPRLQTSQLGMPETEGVEQFDPRDPFSQGWGWWYFDSPQIGIERITWTAEYVPAGTYVLTYTFVPLQAGEYRMLPARAWETYFPEVQAASEGRVFTIVAGE